MFWDIDPTGPDALMYIVQLLFMYYAYVTTNIILFEKKSISTYYATFK